MGPSHKSGGEELLKFAFPPYIISSSSPTAAGFALSLAWLAPPVSYKNYYDYYLKQDLYTNGPSILCNDTCLRQAAESRDEAALQAASAALLLLQELRCTLHQRSFSLDDHRQLHS